MKVVHYLPPSRRPAARCVEDHERTEPFARPPIIGEDSKPWGAINALGCGLALALPAASSRFPSGRLAYGGISDHPRYAPMKPRIRKTCHMGDSGGDV